MKAEPRPYVIANFAITADGKVSTRNSTPTGFTSKEDKRRLHVIRAKGDALLAGASTVEKDTMSMGLSAEDLREARVRRGKPPEPLRVMVSNRGQIDIKWKVFQPRAVPPVVFTTSAMPEKIRGQVAALADLWILPGDTIEIAQVLRILREEFRIARLVCEGGPSLFRSLAAIGAIDELHLTWAPLIFGGAKAPTITGLPGDFLPRTLAMRLAKMEPIGDECFLTYKAVRD